MTEPLTFFFAAFEGTSVPFTYFISAISLLSVVSISLGDEELMGSKFLMVMTISMFGSATLQLVICSPVTNWQTIAMIACLVSNAFVTSLWIHMKQRIEPPSQKEFTPDQGIVRPLVVEKPNHHHSNEIDGLDKGRQIFLKRA